LEIGADDYLVKPFSMSELVARVRVAARRGVRAQEVQRDDTIEIEELIVDPRSFQAYVDGENVALTPTEFRLLYALASEQGRVLTRDELLQKIWDRRLTRRDRTVDVLSASSARRSTNVRPSTLSFTLGTEWATSSKRNRRARHPSRHGRSDGRRREGESLRRGAGAVPQS
jgi:DNA-binding response OmpR family regulator